MNQNSKPILELGNKKLISRRFKEALVTPTQPFSTSGKRLVLFR